MEYETGKKLDTIEHNQRIIIKFLTEDIHKLLINAIYGQEEETETEIDVKKAIKKKEIEE